MTGPHRLIQGYTIVALAAATLTAVAVAQSANAPRNDLPQSYRTTRDWGQLPPGVKWAAVTAVEPAPDGAIYVIHRCVANSCAGREHMFSYFSAKHRTPGRLFRLNYAIDMRYGVLHDIASKVLQGKPIDVSLGHVNFIWQGDASAQALRCLAHCDTPTSPINVSGHEILAVRDLAAKFGQRFGRAPVLVGKEEPTAWLTDTSQAMKLFGLPIVDTGQLISWTADWVSRSMPSLGKPTKYEVRDGRY